jgi:5-methylcytosine-specific restriction endonuclease McrA
MVKQDNDKLGQVVAEARRATEQREQGYREQALKLYPHVCARCGREFSGRSLSELTVHHRDHNHDNNPSDGSNWELLCLYCHDNEHQRLQEAQQGGGEGRALGKDATYNPFADLKSLLGDKE